MTNEQLEAYARLNACLPTQKRRSCRTYAQHIAVAFANDIYVVEVIALMHGKTTNEVTRDIEQLGPRCSSCFAPTQRTAANEGYSECCNKRIS